MAEIARGLGLSARSFHRRLSEHGMSFQSLTEETRRDLAEGLLRDESHSLAEIAFLTGFSEQSSFTRAFKRWVGHDARRATARKSPAADGRIGDGGQKVASPVNTAPRPCAYPLAHRTQAKERNP